MRVSNRLLLAAAIAALGSTAMLGASDAEARGHVVIYATTAPPPLRSERVPPPRRGYVWVPGSWRWAHRRYVWHAGYWVHARRGYHYTAPRWEQDGHRWRYRDGRWDH